MATIRWGTLPTLLLAGVLGGGDAAAAPANDACADAIVIGAIPFTDTRDVSGATSVITDPAFDCSDHSLGTPGVWYRYVAAAPISLQIDTFGSDHDTALRVYGGSCGSETGPLDCNDNDYDNQSFGDQSRVLVTLAAGETALIEVRNLGLPFGGTGLALHVQESPVFRVTPFAHYQNRLGSIARSSDEFLVVWNEHSFPNDFVVARRHDLSGIALAPEFQVNTSPMSYVLPDVAGSDAGFVVAWTADTGIVARRLDGSGTPIGGEIPVGPFAYPLAVAATPGGEFMVVWEDYDDGDRSGVFGRAFDASGTPAGPTFQVNTYTTGRQIEADVTADASGTFTVVWASGDDAPGPTPDGDRLGVFGRRFDVTGVALGPEFQVNTYTTGSQLYPAVAAADDGTFTVVWGDTGDGACFMCVDARRFDASGGPLGPPVRVADATTDTGGFAEGPPFAIAADDTGGFVVVWPQTARHVLVRRLDASGTPIGSPFKVTHLSDGYQYHPDVATAPGGDFVVVWDWSPYGSKYDVMGRHVTPADSGICRMAPRDPGDCHQVIVPGKSKLAVRDRSPDAGDAVTWKWVRGDDVLLAELGDPLATHSYALCLYDAAGFKLEAAVRHGGTCGAKPCWTSLGPDGFRYVDKQGLRGPVRKLVMKPGMEGAAKVIAKVKGDALVMPALPFAPPLRAQLQASNGSCWDVTYDGAGITLNTPSDVKAAGPS